MNNRKQILHYLEEMAHALRELHVTIPFHILVAGGAYMMLQHNRKSTQDIDFALLEYPGVIPTQPFRAELQRTEIAKHTVPYAAEFQEAVKRVAQRHKRLPSDWLNDEAAIYYYDDAPSAEVQFWRSFETLLYVYLPTMPYMLATKLAAYRTKDRNDIQVLLRELQIQRREQAQQIVDMFLPPDTQEFYEIAERLDELFPE